MKAQELIDTARALVAGDKGLLAMDESNPTCNKRFAKLGIPQTVEARRAYRELIITTPGLDESVSGVILYDETIRQQKKDGIPFLKVITEAGIIPGIKVDTGAKDLAGHPGEKITEGLDGLRERLSEYRQMGARFAKWRAVITIGEGIPSPGGLEANAHALARYAALCQETGLVPIVEPEVLMDGDHTLEQCARVTEAALHTVFLLRHGETQASQTGGYCGVSDVALTPEGYQMAADFAAAYKSLPWAAFFCSSLRRSLETARPLCAAVGVEMQPRDGLSEIAYGQWEGKTPEEVNRQFHDEYVRWLAEPSWNRPTGGERGVDVARRSSIVLDEIERTLPLGNVLVVSHKATVRIMLCSLLGIDVGRYRDRLSMPVAALSIVEMTEQGPLLKVLGDRTHLREDLRLRPGT